MKEEQPVTILLSSYERTLISRYGYPFEQIEAQLNRAGDADLVRITDNPYWGEHVLVNLHISETEAHEARKTDVAIELRELINRIVTELGLNTQG